MLQPQPVQIIKKSLNYQSLHKDFPGRRQKFNIDNGFSLSFCDDSSWMFAVYGSYK